MHSIPPEIEREMLWFNKITFSFFIQKNIVSLHFDRDYINKVAFATEYSKYLVVYDSYYL